MLLTITIQSNITIKRNSGCLLGLLLFRLNILGPVNVIMSTLNEIYFKYIIKSSRCDVNVINSVRPMSPELDMVQQTLTPGPLLNTLYCVSTTGCQRIFIFVLSFWKSFFVTRQSRYLLQAWLLLAGNFFYVSWVTFIYYKYAKQNLSLEYLVKNLIFIFN